MKAILTTLFLLWVLQGEATNYLVILVEAPHFDYSSNRAFLRTMAKHPSNLSKNGDVGHAWILLQGDGGFLEGGHSGELGLREPKYFQGIVNLFDFGYVNPTREQRMNPRFEPNPCSYLWTELQDGYFEWGSGGHVPTFAASLEITGEQFQSIVDFIRGYNFKSYCLCNRQCCTFVREVAALVGLKLETQGVLNIEPTLQVAGEFIRLWTDPCFSQLCFENPDLLEQSLRQVVRVGQAASARRWYLRYHRPRRNGVRELFLLPQRLIRAMKFC